MYLRQRKLFKENTSNKEGKKRMFLIYMDYIIFFSKNYGLPNVLKANKGNIYYSNNG